MPELRTKRILLRPVRAEDAVPLHAIFSDAETMRYWSTPPHTDPAQTDGFVAAMMGIDPDTGVEFAVEHEGRVIGKAGLWNCPEIGFIFHRDTWGKGLAKEAVSALMAYAFETYALDAITADVDPRNDRSLRLLAKLGFEETHRAERTIQVGDEWCDSVYLSCPAP